MSIKVMSRVWEESCQKGSALLTLLALADFSNDDGYSWPSVSTIARKTRLQRREEQYLIQALAETPELHVVPRDGQRSHLYFVLTGMTDMQMVKAFMIHLDMSDEDAQSMASSIRARGAKIARVQRNAIGSAKNAQGVQQSARSGVQQNAHDPSSDPSSDPSESIAQIPKVKKKPKVKMRTPYNDLQDALAVAIYGADPNDRAGMNAKMGRVVGLLSGKGDSMGLIAYEMERQGVGRFELDYLALAKAVPTFVLYYHANCGNSVSLPATADKFVDWWSKWRTTPVGESVSRNGQRIDDDPLVDDPDFPGAMVKSSMLNQRIHDREVAERRLAELEDQS